jgi:hypothetical protein
LQPRKTRIVLLELSFSPDEQFVNALLRPDHHPIIGNHQITIADDRSSDRDRTAYHGNEISTAVVLLM